MKKKERKSTRRVIKGADMVVDIEKRLIIMSGSISPATGIAFQKALLKMQDENLDEITVRIRQGNGGCATTAMMIYGLLRTCFAPTRCVVEGYAYSGSLHILQGASRRIMKKKARLKFHWVNARLSSDVWYDIKEIGEIFVYLMQMNEGLYRMMAERTGLPMEDVKAFFAAGKILTAKQALKLSLVDKIIE